MKCPVCPGSELKMSDRQGVEIDYCPSCRGVWLDRGELDKIIDRSVRHEEEHEAQLERRLGVREARTAPQGGYQQPARNAADDAAGTPPGMVFRGYDKYGNPYYKRKKTFVERMFDVLD